MHTSPRKTANDAPRAPSSPDEAHPHAPATRDGGSRVDVELSAAKSEGVARTVHCVKFGKELEGLEKPPLKGELGQKVFENVSKDAWQMWLEHSKMLINEYRLDLTSEQGQNVWFTELENYFFGEGSQLPEGYVPPQAK